MNRVIGIMVLILITTSTSQARIWRVNTVGTGDAPNLYAAMDSAIAGDTVLLGAGTYELSMGSLNVPTNVRLVGDEGPSRTVLSQASYVYYAAVYITGYMSGIHVRASASPMVRTNGIDARFCIFEGTQPTSLVEGPGWNYFGSCVFANGVVSTAGYYTGCIITTGMSYLATGSTVMLSDVLGDVDPSIDVSSANLNFSLDPQFCGVPGSGNYFLMSTSPCLPENNPFGAYLVGPLPMGCGAVRTESKSWGAVKALYR